MSPTDSSPINVSCNLNNADVQFQLDSGASVSTLSLNDANRVGACILPTQRRLLPYNGDSIKLVGAANINVSYNNVRLCHKFFIVSGNKINLLGRDLIHKLNIQFFFS